MILFNELPDFETAWNATEFRVIMAGMGDDTAMVIAELYERGFEPDEIVFCDTGSEFPHTYRFIEHLKAWSAEKQWSKVVVLRKFDKDGEPLKLIEMVERQDTLPAAAFGSKSCSLRFKTETADKYFNNHERAWQAWGVSRKGARLESHTGSILRIVGINSDEPGRAEKWAPEHKWVQVFPLIDWDIGEHESDAVERVGLYYPGKSSCVMCPHLTRAEVEMVRDEYPEIFSRIQRIEMNYLHYSKRDGSGPNGLFRKDTIESKLSGSPRATSFEQSKCGECSG